MTNKETITVDSINQYGPRVGGKNYYPSKKSGLSPEDFEVGKSYTVLVYTSDKGAKYINQIVGDAVVETPKAIVAPVAPVKEAPKAPALSLSEKDTRILIQGLTQAATTCPALQSLPYTNVAELASNIKELAESLISFVRERS